jgi:hypothetical protein
MTCHKFDLGVLRRQAAETVSVFQMILQSHFQTLALILPVKHNVRVITEFYHCLLNQILDKSTYFWFEAGLL